MPNWTFTTTDPGEALKLSLFCLELPFTTERETPDAPAPAQKRKPAKPIDHGCWTDPEARKIRTRVLGWAGRNLKGGPIDSESRYQSPAQAYARALGITTEEAEAKIAAHEAHIAAFAAEQRIARGRR